jgi:hypothetical protein
MECVPFKHPNSGPRDPKADVVIRPADDDTRAT